MDTVRIENLHKKFVRQEVLKGINLTLNSGTITAFIGPNGSGKTTLVKSILGLVLPDEGNIFIEDNSINELKNYRRKIGYMPQSAHFPENLKVIELINMIKDLRGQDAREWELIDYFKLNDSMYKKLRVLSGGTRQKVSAVLAFLFDPPVLLFDEPTVGLDPIVKLNFKQKLIEEKSKGKTILIASHFMREVEELADRIVFLLEGKIYFNGTIAELKAQQSEDNLEKAIAKILSPAADSLAS